MTSINSDIALALTDISSFDNGVKSISAVAQPDRYRHWDEIPTDTYQISRGAGLSLSAASFGEDSVSVSHKRFNRILDFDSSTGQVEVEAGIRLFDLHNFLASKGYYLAIQPGHGQISVGGCIAADVHGKNQLKDGTFLEQVISLKLLHPSHGILELSRELDKEVFFLTCGGYGLTGHVISARLKAQLLPNQFVITRTKSFYDLDSGLNLMSENATNTDFIHSWHDFSKPGRKYGSGVLFISQFGYPGTQSKDYSKLLEINPKELSNQHRLPAAEYIVNRSSIKLLNQIYKLSNRTSLEGKHVNLAKALFPLHKLQSYYYFMGKRGFHEYQILLSRNVATEFLTQLGVAAAELKVPITLASGKIFGGEQHLLRFTGEGICFAVNFLRAGRANELLDWLDKNLVIFGGKPNLIKDSRLPRWVAEASYPEIDRFRRQLKGFDTKRLFRSEFSDRLGL